MFSGGALRRGVLLAAAGGAIAPNAHAGAWALADGMQKWFATISREDGEFGQPWRTDDFSELGLRDGWGLTARFESQIRIGD